MTCQQCKGPLSTQDQASYGERCEDCYVGRRMSETNGLPAALRLGKGDSRLNQFGSGKYQKPKHQTQT
jgi:hypothetical protein